MTASLASSSAGWAQAFSGFWHTLVLQWSPSAWGWWGKLQWTARTEAPKKSQPVDTIMICHQFLQLFRIHCFQDQHWLTFLKSVQDHALDQPKVNQPSKSFSIRVGMTLSRPGANFVAIFGMCSITSLGEDQCLEHRHICIPLGHKLPEPVEWCLYSHFPWKVW